MGNPFDQFDQVQPQNGNPFDQFDMPNAKPTSFFSRVGEDLSKRADQIDAAGAAYRGGDKSMGRAAADIVGAYGGGIGDVVANGIGSLARQARDVVMDPGINTLLGGDASPEVQQVQSQVGDLARQKAQTVGNYAMQPGTGFAPSPGDVIRYAQNQLGPDATAVAGDAVNALNIIPGMKIISKAGEGLGTLASGGGQVLKDAGQGIIDSRKANFTKTLVMPVQTKSVLEDQVDRTTQSPIFGKKIVAPDSMEQASIDAVSQVPGVSKFKSYQANYNTIADANQNEAQNLISTLKKNDVAIPDDTLINALSDVRNNLAKNPYVVGGGEKAAEATVNNALDIIQKHPQTASGLLQARKEFDNLVRSQKPKIFDATSDTPVSAAIKEVRQSINNLVDQAIPNAEVKASLAKQNALYNAMDNIAPKAASEGNNRVSRLVKSASDSIPIKNPVVKTAAEAAALGGLITAPVVAPTIIGTGAALYGANKALPYALKAAGFTLDNAGNLLKGGAKLTARDIGMLSPALAMQVLNLNQGKQQ